MSASARSARDLQARKGRWSCGLAVVAGHRDRLISRRNRVRRLRTGVGCSIPFLVGLAILSWRSIFAGRVSGVWHLLGLGGWSLRWLQCSNEAADKWCCYYYPVSFLGLISRRQKIANHTADMLEENVISVGSVEGRQFLYRYVVPTASRSKHHGEHAYVIWRNTVFTC